MWNCEHVILMFCVIQTIMFSLAIFILSLIIVIAVRNLSLLKCETQGRDKGRLELTVEGVRF